MNQLAEGSPAQPTESKLWVKKLLSELCSAGSLLARDRGPSPDGSGNDQRIHSLIQAHVTWSRTFLAVHTDLSELVAGIQSVRNSFQLERQLSFSNEMCGKEAVFFKV